MTGLDRIEASARSLALAFSASPVAVGSFRGAELACEYVNASFTRLLGELAVGRSLREAGTIGPLHALAEACERVYRGGESLTIDDLALGSDGTSAVVSLALSAQCDASGRIVGVLAIAHERTHELLARRRSEARLHELQEREERLRLAQEASPIGLVHYRALRDAAGTVVDFELLYQNRAASAINGFPAGEATSGLTLCAMFPSVRGTDVWRRHLEALERGATEQEELRYVDERIDGWFRVSRTRPHHEHLLIVFEDISTAKRLEDQQREEAQVNEILLRVAGAISELDLASIVQKVTDEATNVCRAEFGAFFYNTVDVRGESYMLYSLAGVPRSAFSSFPMPRNTDVFGPTFRGERVVRSADITNEPEYGHSPPYHGMPPGHLPVRSYLAVPVVSRDGRVLGGLFLGHAAVDRFTARDERTVVAIAQQAAVAMDNARLYELSRRERAIAEEASRMKDDFLATISHELRTPLQSILGWAHMLRSGSLSSTTTTRALEAVERNAKAQAKLVEDILDMSRIIAGKLRIEVEPVSVVEVVQAAIETVRPAAEARDIRVQALLDPDAGTVMGDASRLQQVVWNLLINAVKFSNKGGRVYVHVRREHSSVEIVVADNGQGIAGDFLPHVFERFRQGESGYTRKTGGLGLGLSIVKHLVELHGGTVTAESEGLQKGATFTIRIPMAPLRRELPSAPAELDLICPPSIAGARILVVDDEEDARDLLRTVLEHCSARVVTAAGSAEALELVRRDPPDVLVSDIGMPGEDGYTLIERVRALPAERGGRTPAIALTAFARAEERTRALLKGFNHHIAKPVNLHELLITIANLIASYSR
jgi:signal transduction histidine kinase/PAS domain-containing protein